MDYNLDKELPNQKEKLWKVLVYWFRGIRMYADIEMSNKNIILILIRRIPLKH